jgi:hypothetical protein
MVPFETDQLYVGSGVTDVMLKFTNPLAQNTAGFAVIVPGVLGLPMIVMVRGVLVPGQLAELAVTVKNPLLKFDDTVNCIVVLPCPLVIVVPAGLVQL